MRKKDTLADAPPKATSQVSEPRKSIRPDMIFVGALVLLGICATAFKLVSILSG